MRQSPAACKGCSLGLSTHRCSLPGVGRVHRHLVLLVHLLLRLGSLRPCLLDVFLQKKQDGVSVLISAFHMPAPPCIYAIISLFAFAILQTRKWLQCAADS